MRSTFGWVPSHLARTTFCWLPPLGGAVGATHPETYGGLRHQDVLAHRHVEHQAQILAVGGNVGESSADRLERTRVADRCPRDLEATAHPAIHPEERLQELTAA